MNLVMKTLTDLQSLPLLHQAAIACLTLTGVLSLLFGVSDKPKFYLGKNRARMCDTGYRSVVIVFFFAVHIAVLAALADLGRTLGYASVTTSVHDPISIVKSAWGIALGPLWFWIWTEISGYGITAGYHRIATHTSCEMPNWVRALFYLAGQTAGQQSVIVWRATHTYHHAHSDEPDDVSSRLWKYGKPIGSKTAGWWHSHMGWIMIPLPEKLGTTLAKRIQRVQKRDPTAAWVSQTYALCIGFPIALSYLIGGWPLVIWRLAALCVTYHATWCVNSISHGDEKNPIAGDYSQNLLGFVAWITKGESIHGIHHNDPRGGVTEDPEILKHDATGRLLLKLEELGCISDLRRHKQNPQPREPQRKTVGDLATA